MMFGYATNETEDYMPAAIYYARKLANRLTDIREKNGISYLRPDGKTQVTCQYENDELVKIDTIVISTQHLRGIPQSRIEKDIINTRKNVWEKLWFNMSN